MTSTKLVMVALLAATALTGCKKREEILTGQRFDTRVPLEETLPDENGVAPAVLKEGNRSESIAVGQAVSLSQWVNRGGTPTHDLPNLSLSANPKLIFATAIGQGNDRKHRITADPIVVGGRVFTLDSYATVTATGTNGATAWTVDLTPPSDKVGDASGGGLAYGDGKIFAATGFGTLVALDSASGKTLWTQRIEGVSAASPTVSNGLVYVITRG
jgi:outer membrane protein assembly factor BamB